MREARDSELRLGCACDDEMVAAHGDCERRQLFPPRLDVSCISWQQQQAVECTNAGGGQSAR